MLSFKQAVVGKEGAIAAVNAKNTATKPAAASAASSPSSVVQVDFLSSGLAGSQENLVALELKCIEIPRPQNGDASVDFPSEEDGACKSDSEAGCTVLDGPYVFVQAKLYDVSSSNSRNSSVIMSETDSGDELADLSQAKVSPKGLRRRRPDHLRLRVDGNNHTDGDALAAAAEAQAAMLSPDPFASPPFTPHQFNFDYPATPHEKVSIELDCPQRFVGRLIGKRGTTVRRLEQATGVTIQIDQNLPEGEPRRVKLSGHPSIIDDAEKVVKEVINYGPPELNKKNVYKMPVNVVACETARKQKGRAEAKRRGRLDARRGLGPSLNGAVGFFGGRHHPRQALDYSSGLYPTAAHQQPGCEFCHRGVGSSASSDSGGCTAPFGACPSYYAPGPPSPLHVPPPPPAAFYSPAHAAAGMYMPGFPNMKPSFKVAANAVVAANRFWSEHRSATGEKYFVNQYTGELMTDLKSGDKVVVSTT